MHVFTKAETVDVLFDSPEFKTLSKSAIKRAVDDFYEQLAEMLIAKKQICLRTIGWLCPHDKAARPGRNPKTGEPAEITPRVSYNLRIGSLPNIEKVQLSDLRKLRIEGLCQYQVHCLVDEFMHQVTRVSQDTNCRMEIRGFGVFSSKTFKARQRRNPRTGETVEVGESIRTHFRISSLLKRRLIK